MCIVWSTSKDYLIYHNISVLHLLYIRTLPIVRLNRQIWYRHPNSEAGNDEIQNVQKV
jgi:hypothetical protein